MAKLAFLFAGQGAQAPGMGRALYAASKAARAVFDRGEALSPGVLDLCFNGPAEALNQTLNAQPCLFLMDLACARAAEEAGLVAAGAAGFSLGELPAAAFCGLLSEKEAFLAVLERARLMQAAAEQNPGAMCAVLKLPSDEVLRLANEHGVYAVNFNAPGQTVVSGLVPKLEGFERAVAASGGRAARLKVGGAFHSPYLEGASATFYAHLSSYSFLAPRIPLYSNLSALPYGENPRAALALQMKSPVLWQQSIEAMRKDGFTAFVELGAGKTLSGLTRRIDETLLAASIDGPESLQSALNALKGAQNG
ncbi:MAG: ACP S-malonyltransferase [Christensenellaceae bacterium]|jgi:[acyl-carrier-protein] S-malonyltransferase|nr:ACP S-malonyltransferase [Christensenellaceae bacterium]